LAAVLVLGLPRPAWSQANPTVDPTTAPATAAGAATTRLTRREVVARAVEKGPSLASRAAEREAAQARVDQAVAAFLPRLKVSATYRRVAPVEVTLGDAAIVGARTEGALFMGPSPAPGLPNLVVDAAGQPVGAQLFTVASIENQYELKAEVGVPLSDLLFRMQKAVGAARAGEGAAAAMENAERQKIALDATLAYYGFARADASVEVSRRSLERTRALLADTQAIARAGMTTEADVLRVDALVAATEVAVAEAERMRALTRRQLQILLDDDRLEPAVGEAIAADRAATPVPSVDEATRLALANRRELAALRDAVAATEKKQASSRVARYPRLDGFAQVVEGRPNNAIFLPTDAWQPTWAVGVTVSYSPNDTVVNGAAAAESRADESRLRAELENAERNVKLQTAAAVYDLTKARGAIDAAERGAQAATRAQQAASALYRAGEATATDVLDAETRLLAAELQLVYARLDLAIAATRIDYAVGRDLTRS